MAITPTDPSRERYRKAWARMDRKDRRRVMRAVSRMRPLEAPAEAALAIEFAQRQRRMWVRWWWVMPLIAGAAAIPGGIAPVIANLLVATLLMGGIARANVWRADRSTRINVEALEASRRKKRRPAKQAPPAGSSAKAGSKPGAKAGSRSRKGSKRAKHRH